MAADPLLRFRPEFPILEKTTYLISSDRGLSCVDFENALEVVHSDDQTPHRSTLLRAHERGIRHDVDALSLQDAANAVGNLGIVALQETLAALYQVNVQVPAGVTPGSVVPLVITATNTQTGVAAQSNSVTIAQNTWFPQSLALLNNGVPETAAEIARDNRCEMAGEAKHFGQRFR